MINLKTTTTTTTTNKQTMCCTKYKLKLVHVRNTENGT
jgi:hypothetical protein